MLVNLVFPLLYSLSLMAFKFMKAEQRKEVFLLFIVPHLKF